MAAKTPAKTKALPGPSSTAPTADPVLSRLRKELKLTAKDFARITGFSERAVVSWEAGSPISEPAKRRLLEVRRLFKSLAELVAADALPGWFQTPNDAFGGLKPVEVVERGETDRLWRMVYFLEAGLPV
jgi:transcriptional regulator with XRE-family HTH domain